MSLTDEGWEVDYNQTRPTDMTYTSQEPSDELDFWKAKTEMKSRLTNNTTYHYRLGFKVNDNIELNFLNFADLTNLRSWVLGVNIKF